VAAQQGLLVLSSCFYCCCFTSYIADASAAFTAAAFGTHAAHASAEVTAVFFFPPICSQLTATAACLLLFQNPSCLPMSPLHVGGKRHVPLEVWNELFAVYGVRRPNS
jgi:hypothetical protein